MKALLRKTLKIYVDSYSGHPKEIWAIGIFTFINRLGTMVLPFLTVYLNTIKGFTLKEAGFLLTAFGIGSLGGTFLGGKLSDKIGPNPVMIASLFFSGICLIILQFAETFNQFFFLILLTALLGDAYRPAMSAAVGIHVPKNETGRSMSFIRIAINLGWSAAAGIGGFIAVSLGYNWLFWIDGSTCILSAIYFFIVSSSWKPVPIDSIDSNPKQKSLPEKSRPPYQDKTFLLYLFASFLMGVGFIQWFHTIPLFIKTDWGFDERYIGMMMTLNGILIVLLEMPLVDQIEKAQKLKVSLLGGMALLGISFFPFLLPASLYFFCLATLFFTFGEIFFFPFNNSLPINMSPESRRGEYMSWYWMSWSACSIIGPSIGLSFIDEFGYDAFWIFIISLMLLSWLIKRQITPGIIAKHSTEKAVT
ncbi:MAG: MFS transporter [Bacteroidota bacterium]